MTPELRFPEFSGEWQVKKLGDVVKFSRGNLLSKNDLKDDGRYKAIHYGELFTQYNEIIGEIKSRTDLDTGKKSLAGEILMPTSDVTPQGLARASVIHEDGVMIGGDINILKPDQEISSDFLSYLLNSQKKKIMRLVSGTTVRHVYASDLRKASYVFPQKPEQEKIADFLTAVDERIAVGEKKLELLETYKRGVMQKIFSQQIRFKDENGNDYPEWEEKKLGDIAKKENSPISANEIVGRSGKYKVYGASGLLQTIDSYNQGESYTAIVKDGAGVGRLMWCEAESSVLGTLNIIKPKLNGSSKFLHYLLHTINFQRYSIGSTIPHVYFSDYSKHKLVVPENIEEQQKIAAFLTALDDKITAEKSKLTAVRQFKKALLQRMFV